MKLATVDEIAILPWFVNDNNSTFYEIQTVYIMDLLIVTLLYSI